MTSLSSLVEDSESNGKPGVLSEAAFASPEMESWETHSDSNKQGLASQI